jgi:hypothetical protein
VESQFSISEEVVYSMDLQYIVFVLCGIYKSEMLRRISRNVYVVIKILTMNQL